MTLRLTRLLKVVMSEQAPISSYTEPIVKHVPSTHYCLVKQASDELATKPFISHKKLLPLSFLHLKLSLSIV